MRDVIRHRAEHSLGAAHSSVADDDHLGVLLFRQPHQSRSGLPGPYMGLTRDAELRQSLLRSVHVVLGTGSLLLLLVDLGRGKTFSRRHPQATRASAVAAHDLD